MNIQNKNIIFDILILICGFITLFISIITLILMYFSRRTKEKDQINNLLTANPFITLIIVGLFTLDMFGYTLYGHLHPNSSFDGWWCKLKSSFTYSSGASFMYSLFLHAIYRFCRIVFPMKIRFQSLRLYQYGIIIQWLYCILTILILILTDDIRYVIEDHNCQVEITNMRGMLILIPIVYCIPSWSTSICYNYTLYYYRKHNTTIRIDARQQINTRRDIAVLKSIFMILTFVIIVGLPTVVLCIISYTSYPLPWWSRQLGWLSVALAYGFVPFVLIFVSPQLRKLWIQPWHRIHP